MRMRASFNPCLRRWASALTVSGGGRDRAEGVGLAAAAAAAHRQHRKALARDEPGDDVARLLEADVDLHGEAGRAEPALVTREHAAHGRGDALRPLLGPQPRRTKTVETPLVEALVGEAPCERLTGPQLPAAHRARLVSRARLDVGERRGSDSRRSHERRSSNADATQSRTERTHAMASTA